MNKDLSYLWTPKTTLRLRDTAGTGSQERRCIRCSALFKSDTSAVCPACETKHKLDNTDTKPEFKGVIRHRDPDGMVRCLLCAKLYAATGQVHHDQVCSECKKTMRDSAKLVCSKCNIVICRLAPSILDSGFIIRPNMVLHSDSCNICKPGLSESNILEIDLWQKTKRAKKTVMTGFVTKG